SNPATLYVGTSSRGIFKSTDAGAHWARANNGFIDFRLGVGDIKPVKSLVIDFHATTTLYAGAGGSRVFKSVDGGATWALSSAGMPDSAFVTALVQDPSAPAALYAGTGFDGIFKSTDGGSSWTPSNAGIPGVTEPDGSTRFGGITSLVIDPSQPSTL